jgi:hypothetical protein
VFNEGRLCALDQVLMFCHLFLTLYQEHLCHLQFLEWENDDPSIESKFKQENYEDQSIDWQF